MAAVVIHGWDLPASDESQRIGVALTAMQATCGNRPVVGSSLVTLSMSSMQR